MGVIRSPLTIPGINLQVMVLDNPRLPNTLITFYVPSLKLTAKKAPENRPFNAPKGKQGGYLEPKKQTPFQTKPEQGFFED